MDFNFFFQFSRLWENSNRFFSSLVLKIYDTKYKLKIFRKWEIQKNNNKFKGIDLEILILKYGGFVLYLNVNGKF